MLGQGFSDRGPGNVAQLGELVKPIGTGIEIVVLELVGGRMSSRGIVDSVEAIDVLCVDDWLGRARTLASGRPRDRDTGKGGGEDPDANPLHIPLRRFGRTKRLG